MSGPKVDPICPGHIEHCLEEIWIGDRLVQQYNYFEYHFERDNAYCRVRSYVDNLDKVVLYGPFDARGSIRTVTSVSFEYDVQVYLQRRFRNVERG